MRLRELINHMYENTTIWIAEESTESGGLFFDEVKCFDKEGELANRIVKEFYPEHYPAIGRLVGITIIVERVR